jgi:hypothetical protein
MGILIGMPTIDCHRAKPGNMMASSNAASGARGDSVVQRKGWYM